MAPRRNRGAAVLAAAGVACCAVTKLSSAFVGGYPAQQNAASLVTRQAAVPGMGDFDMKSLNELMKDPEKMKQLQAEADKIMQDPDKAKMVEQWNSQMQASVQKLEEDPEMKEFFEDVRKNGLDAMKKYENDERILAKFSQATGGPQAMAGMAGMPGGMGAPAAPANFAPGDTVFIRGLAKAPQLNGKKAMVVPPTAEEQKSLAGTNRLIVRLLEGGDQFAIKPENLRTASEEVDELMSKNLEDVSLYNPALQTEAAKLRDSGKLEDLRNDPALKPIFEDIQKNGMSALEKYWDDEELMAKINKVMR